MGKIGDQAECIMHMNRQQRSPTHMAFFDHSVLKIINQIEVQLTSYMVVMAKGCNKGQTSRFLQCCCYCCCCR